MKLFIFAWLFNGVIAAGFYNASFRGPDHDVSAAASLGVSMLFGPVALVSAPFATGFFRRGWTLSWKPIVTKSDYTSASAITAASTSGPGAVVVFHDYPNRAVIKRWNEMTQEERDKIFSGKFNTRPVPE